MKLKSEKFKETKSLLIFAAILAVIVIYCESIFKGIGIAFSILSPFFAGGAIAFLVNIPMNFIENKLFRGKYANLKCKRPISLILSIILLIVIFTLVILIVVPQLTRTAKEIANVLPDFALKVVAWLETLFTDNAEVTAALDSIKNMEINWSSILSSVTGFLKSGVLGVVSSTVEITSSIISGAVNAVVAIVFSIYILLQKETLGRQTKKLCRAYAPKKTYDFMCRLSALLHKNFKSFITGQVIEALILGALFFVCMSVLGIPYALMIGVLISFTALIPIVGAFIGFFVGVLLIVMVDPIKALIFAIMFFVLQQIEGNLIYPKVVGNSVGLPSIWVLFAVTIGASLMGILGIIIFIPLIATAYTLLKDDVAKRNRLKELPED